MFDVGLLQMRVGGDTKMEILGVLRIFVATIRSTRCFIGPLGPYPSANVSIPHGRYLETGYER
jgi:hypothetical protein